MLERRGDGENQIDASSMRSSPIELIEDEMAKKYTLKYFLAVVQILAACGWVSFISYKVYEALEWNDYQRASFWLIAALLMTQWGSGKA